MRSRNLIFLLAGVTVALVTLFVSWRFGIVFFLLPLFFVWSWGGDERGGDERSAASEERPAIGEEGPGPRPPDEPGLDGEGI